MNIILAQHHGMCFGVRDALRTTHAAAQHSPLTILGQLVHNPLVDRHLAALAMLVTEGYQTVVIGQSQHVEVRGLIGDFPSAVVVLESADLVRVPAHPKLGIVSQTTQPVELALRLVDAIKRRHRDSEVRFIDTICHPTKQRQTAMDDLLRDCDHIVVIGGRNSNNTLQLVQKATTHGLPTLQIEHDDELDPDWFCDARNVGVTAGTSTLDETVDAVMQRLRQIAAERCSQPVHEFLRSMLQAA